MAPVISDEYRERKKTEIIENALTCFAEKGFQAATIDDIVKLSGISKGSIYTYFKSKEDIYISLMNEKTERSTNALLEELSAIPSAIEKIKYIFDIYIEQPAKQNWIDTVKVHTEFFLHASRDDQLKEVLNNRAKNYYNNVIIDILDEGKKSGEVTTTSDNDVLSRLFWSIINGISFQYATLEEAYPYKEALQEAKNMFINTLTK